MFRTVTLSCFITTLSLAGCAQTSYSTTSTTFTLESENGKQQVLLPYHEDPDGDMDNKGTNHFPLTREATGNKVFIFDPKYGAWAAYNSEGQRVNTGKASGGSTYCHDVGRECKTIVGKFKVISKGNANCKSNKFPLPNGGAKMPYCMYFSPKGYAIHGSNDIPSHNASHGCVRITTTVAKWLSNNFITVGTTVIVLPYHETY